MPMCPKRIKQPEQATTPLVCSQIMDRNVISHVEILKALLKAKPSVRKSLFETCSCDLIRCLVECAHNVLLGNVRLSSSQKTRLYKHRERVRRLAKQGESVKHKRQFLVQHGTGVFLDALLLPLIQAILQASSSYGTNQETSSG